MLPAALLLMLSDEPAKVHPHSKVPPPRGGMLPALLLPMIFEASNKPYPFAGLFDGPFEELSDFQAFVQRFNELIEDPSPLSPTAVEYLTSEGGRVESDGALDYHHRDYWLDKILRKRLSITGRLPWGENSPELLVEADPLGLRLNASGALRGDVIIVDPQATSSDSDEQFGPVRVTYGTNNCTLPDGVTAKNAGFSASLWSGSTGTAYRYQFWTRLEDLHEAGGSSTVRFLDAGTGIGDKTVTVYVRYADDHQLSKELLWRKRAAGSHAKQIIIRGYPGERPVIRMGSEFQHRQTISITGPPTSGGFQLTFNGQTTASIAHDAAATGANPVLARLEAISNIAPERSSTRESFSLAL